MRTNRSVVIAERMNGIVVSHRGLDHQAALWLAGDMAANDGWKTRVIRLPRRLFKGRLRAYHNTWMLEHGLQPSQVL